MDALDNLKRIRNDLADRRNHLDSAILNVDTAIRDLLHDGDTDVAVARANKVIGDPKTKPEKENGKGRGRREWNEEQRKEASARMRKRWAQRKRDEKRKAKAESEAVQAA